MCVHANVEPAPGPCSRVREHATLEHRGAPMHAREYMHAKLAPVLHVGVVQKPARACSVQPVLCASAACTT